MSDYQDIQWFSGSGSGVRSYKLYNITKVHLWTGSGRTLCGRWVPLPSRRTWPYPDDARCVRCAARAGQTT